MKKSIILASIISVFASTAAMAHIDTNAKELTVEARYENKPHCAITTIDSTIDVAFLNREADSVATIKVVSNTGDVKVSMDDNQSNVDYHEVEWHTGTPGNSSTMKQGVAYPININNGVGSVQVFPQVQANTMNVKAGTVEASATFTVSCE